MWKSHVQAEKSLVTSTPSVFSVPCVCAAVAFTDEEKEQLRKFNNRSYLLDKAARYQAWLSLLDILLAYCYEVRSTEGEHTVSDCMCKEETPLSST